MRTTIVAVAALVLLTPVAATALLLGICAACRQQPQPDTTDAGDEPATTAHVDAACRDEDARLWHEVSCACAEAWADARGPLMWAADVALWEDEMRSHR